MEPLFKRKRGGEKESVRKRETKEEGRERESSPSFASRPRAVVHHFGNGVRLLAVAGRRSEGFGLRGRRENEEGGDAMS